MATTLYGLKNCDSCRKALQWLRQQNIDAQLHDVREAGLPAELLDQWLDDCGWETLLNRRSTSWRQLDSSEREPLDQARARVLLLKYPTLLKRPVVELNGQLQVGFSEARYATVLAGAD